MVHHRLSEHPNKKASDIPRAMSIYPIMENYYIL